MIEEITISGENQFTNWKYFSGNSNVDLSIGGTLSDSTVTLQRKFKKYGDILDSDIFTFITETFFFVSAPGYYRVGVKSGDYGLDSPKLKMVY